VKLDDAIHDLLSDAEYDADVETCEGYIETAKRAIQTAKREIENKLATATVELTLRSTLSSSAPTPAVSVTHSVKLPPIKLEPFSGDIETWARFWEQFEASIDQDPSLSTINKHVFLHGYLDGEPKLLVDGIAVLASTYEDTKGILQARYRDRNRIIQAYLDYLEEITPIQLVTPERLNVTFIECNRRVQALRALGEDIQGYGRVLAPKILRAFPEDICRRWILHVKREKLSEGDILRLMEFLSYEVDGALTAQKIRGDLSSSTSLVPTAATLHVHSKPGRSTGKPSRKAKVQIDPFCAFCEQRGHWAQDCGRVTNINERIERLKSSNRCFLCLNHGHNVRDCRRRGKAACSKCKRNHHRSVCTDSENAFPQAESTSVGKIEITPLSFTYLQTARVWISGPTGLRKCTRCILDCGSQSSFVSKDLIDQLKLNVIGHRDLAVNAFESSQPTPTSRRVVSLSVTGALTKAVSGKPLGLPKRKRVFTTSSCSTRCSSAVTHSEVAACRS
jgi:hypothetical protein